MVNMKYLTILFTFAIYGCNENKMPAYDGSNPFEYYTANCTNKPAEIMDSQECKKANDDDSRQRLRASPMKAK